MARYAYRLTEGRANNLRFVPLEYVLQDGELGGDANMLPSIDDVSTAPLPTPRRSILKSLILSRLTDVQLDLALAAMSNRQKERWRSPDNPSVFADDPEVLGLVMAIGADPNMVLAP